jgi:flagellar hook-basal body complex protein FliE
MPIEAISAGGISPLEVGGTDWQISLPESPGDAAPVEGSKGFGGMLADQIQGLQGLQTEAATQSQALATGQAEDASQVVMAVERAQLSMQLAAQLRDKSVESFQEVFRTQV